MVISTSAHPSVFRVSRFTCAVVRSIGIDAHTMGTAVGCSHSTLINIWKNTQLTQVSKFLQKDPCNFDTEVLPWHIIPFPEYLGLRAQMCDSLESSHTALRLQLCIPVAHSSTSEKTKPLNDKSKFTNHRD